VRNALGSAVFFLIAPATVMVFLPQLLGLWRVEPPLLGIAATRYLGAVLFLAGPLVVVESFMRFVREGRGTPFPTAAPERLVVGGAYRWVRNPMYAAIVTTLVGESLVFGNEDLFFYAAIVFAVFHTFVVTYEEPALRARFGADYDAYRARVPRWIPKRPS
jgi:protein-S-isoprenylcysteine O-methyltransferase Ste14